MREQDRGQAAYAGNQFAKRRIYLYSMRRWLLVSMALCQSHGFTSTSLARLSFQRLDHRNCVKTDLFAVKSNGRNGSKVRRRSATKSVSRKTNSRSNKRSSDATNRKETDTETLSFPMSSSRNGEIVEMEVTKVPKRRHNYWGENFDLWDHDLLSAEEEQSLGRKIRRAIAIKEEMASLVAQKHEEQLEKGLLKEEMEDDNDFLSTAWDDLESDDMAGLSVVKSSEQSTSVLEEFEMRSMSAGSLISQDNDDLSLWDASGVPTFDLGSETSSSADFVSAFDGDTDQDVRLTENDIIDKLNITGGREELRHLLIEGAFARDKLISSNIRLVVSIAKKWCQMSTSTSGKNADHSFRKIFEGSSVRPSLDEAVQEGILGLAKAADRFEPERKFKFGTYATYWITSYVRSCFQTATTGVLRIPPNYHALKQKYMKVVTERYKRDGSAMPMEEAATTLGITVERLLLVLKLTQPLVSMDSPMTSASNSRGVGGKAGSFEFEENDSLLTNTLPCTDPQPEENVENSLLRQCLENAMSTELSPHERDVLRLRHGLDDGVTRTAREVIELCGGNLSITDIRMAELRAFRKLRSPYSVHTFHLLGFLDYVEQQPEAQAKRSRRKRRRPTRADA